MLMRKHIISFIAGILFASAMPTYAAVTSIAGKSVKIQGEFPVLVDGVELQKKSIAIDGTTYIPLRVAADSFGYDSSFVNKTVILEKKEDVTNVEETQESTPIEQTTKRRVEAIEEDIVNWTIQKQMVQGSLDTAKYNVEKGINVEKNQESIKEYQTILDTINQKLNDLEKEKQAAEAAQ